MKNHLRILFVALLACGMLAALTVSAVGDPVPLCFIGDPLPLCCAKVGGPQQVYSALCASGGQVYRTTICTGPCLL